MTTLDRRRLLAAGLALAGTALPLRLARASEPGVLRIGYQKNGILAVAREQARQRAADAAEADDRDRALAEVGAAEHALAGGAHRLPDAERGPRAGVAGAAALDGEAGVRHVFHGWPTFTPDGRFIVGASRQVRGFVMAGGCNAHGVSGSAGIGRHVVEALLEPRPGAYVRSLGPDRFGATGWDWDEALRRAQAIYETYYHIGH